MDSDTDFCRAALVLSKAQPMGAWLAFTVVLIAVPPESTVSISRPLSVMPLLVTPDDTI
jgi:hypothetical protein